MNSFLKPNIFALIFLVLMTTNLYAHKSHNNKAPWIACAEKRLDDSCHWVTEKHSIYEGSCRSIADALICVRNKPIRKEGTTADSEKEVVVKNQSIGLGTIWLGLLFIFGLLAIGFTIYQQKKTKFKN